VPMDANFDATVAQFQQLLKQSNYPSHLVWLTPEDVLMTGKRLIYVRVPIPSTNESTARRTYDEGVANGRGLIMSTICEMDASAGCYIWYPKASEEVPQGIWPNEGSAKLSAKIDASRQKGKAVKSTLHWALLKFRHQKNQTLNAFQFS
jgi:hypothetical protein